MARFNRLAGMTLLCGALMVPLLGVPRPTPPKYCPATPRGRTGT